MLLHEWLGLVVGSFGSVSEDPFRVQVSYPMSLNNQQVHVHAAVEKHVAVPTGISSYPKK